MPSKSTEITTNVGASVQVQEIVTPASSRALFWRPRYLASSESLNHLPFLFWLVDIARPTVVAQIGMGDGVAYFGICQALERSDVSARAFAVSGDPLGSEVAERNEDYADVSSLAVADAAEFAGRFGPGSVDVLSISEAPKETDAAAFADQWEDRLSAQGIILIHAAASWPKTGAARLWLDKLGLQHPVITLEDEGGLLVILVGTNQPAQLLSLAQLDPTSIAASETQRVFRRLGQGVWTEWAARDRLAKLDVAQARAQDAESQLSQSETRIAAQDAELGALRDLLVRKETDVAVLEAKISTSESIHDASGLSEILRQQNKALSELGTLRANLAEAEAKLVEERRIAEAAKEECEAARTAMAEAEHLANDRVAAKDRALQQISVELAAVKNGTQSNSTSLSSDELRSLTLRLEAGREERDAVNRDLQALKYRHSELREENEVLSEEADRLRSEIDALLSSTSWRVMAPARKLILGLRRLTGRG